MKKLIALMILLPLWLFAASPSFQQLGLPVSSTSLVITNTQPVAILGQVVTIQVGQNSAADTGSDSIAFGINATAGNGLGAGGAISIGSDSQALAVDSITVGHESSATVQDAIAIGANTVVTGNGSVALGTEITLNSDFTIQLGRSTYSTIIPGSLRVGAGISGNANSSFGAVTNLVDTNLVSQIAANGQILAYNAAQGHYMPSNAPTLTPQANVALTNGVPQVFVNANTFNSSNQTALSILDNTNTYGQVTFQNISTGASASTEFSAVADNGSSTNAFFSFGINSSRFVGGPAPIGTNTAYLLAMGNSTNVANASNTVNIMIVASQTNSTINLSAGNAGTQTNVQIGNYGISTIGTNRFNGDGGGLTNLNAAQLVGPFNPPIVTNLSSGITLSNVTGKGTSTFGSSTALTIDNTGILTSGQVIKAPSFAGSGSQQLIGTTGSNPYNELIGNDGTITSIRLFASGSAQLVVSNNGIYSLSQPFTGNGSGLTNLGGGFVSIGTNAAVVTTVTGALVLGTPNTNLFAARCIYTYAVQMNDSAVTGSPFLVFSNFTRNYALTNGNTFVIAGGVLMHANTPVISTNDVIGLYDKSTGSASVSLISCLGTLQ